MPTRVLRPLGERVRWALTALVIDRRRGIETWRPVDVGELGVPLDESVAYEPSDWLVVRKALSRIEISSHDVFLDLGSGKGRVLLEAARHPFKRIIGVEASAELNRIAATNIEATRPRLCCQAIELVECDANQLRVPDDVTVTYAFNPFVGATFDAAMRALIASFDRRPRRLRLIYVNPKEHERLVDSGRFRLLMACWRWRPRPTWMRGPPIHIYEVRPGDYAGSGEDLRPSSGAPRGRRN